MGKPQDSFQFSLRSILFAVFAVSVSLAGLRIGPFIGLLSLTVSTILLVTYFVRKANGGTPFDDWFHDWIMLLFSSCLLVGIGWVVVGLCIFVNFPSDERIAFDSVRSDDIVRLQSVLPHVNGDSTQRDQYSHDRLTLLSFAVVDSSPEIVKLLLTHGHDPNHQGGGWKMTPLHRVVSIQNNTTENRIRIIRLLLAKGANPLLRNARGETPLDLARLNFPEAMPEFNSDAAVAE